MSGGARKLATKNKQDRNPLITETIKFFVSAWAKGPCDVFALFTPAPSLPAVPNF